MLENTREQARDPAAFQIIKMSSDKRRTRPMEVLCLGLPRTGTMSIQHALRALGYQNVFHCDPPTLFPRPKFAHKWLAMTRKKFIDHQPITSAEIEDTLWEFDACTDVPPPYFWREMLDAYPDAKVILIERHVESWYQSFVVNLMLAMDHSRAAWWHMNFAEPVLDRREAAMIRAVNLAYFQAASMQELAANAREVYARHYREIREECEKRGRPILDYQLGSGWEPLCAFLGKPVPKDAEFPRLNDQAALQKDIDAAQWAMVRAAAWRVLEWTSTLGAVVGAGAWWYMRRR